MLFTEDKWVCIGCCLKRQLLLRNAFTGLLAAETVLLHVEAHSMLSMRGNHASKKLQCFVQMTFTDFLSRSELKQRKYANPGLFDGI